MKIFPKLLCGFLAVAALIGITGVLAYRQVISQPAGEIIRDAQLEAGIIAFFLTQKLEESHGGEAEALKRADLPRYVEGLHALRQRDLVIVDRQKRILADKVQAEVGRTFAHDPNDEVGQTIRDGKPRNFMERSTDYPQGVKQIVVPWRTARWGTVGALILDYTAQEQEILDLAWGYGRLFLGLYAALLALTLGVGYAVSRNISRRLQGLQQVTRGVAAGHLDLRADEASGDEVGELARSFNRMTADLKRLNGDLIRQALQERLQTLVAQTGVVFFTCRPEDDLPVTFFSDNVTQVLGYEPREFLAGPDLCRSRMHPGDREAVQAALPALWEQGRQVLEYRFQHRDGAYRWMHAEIKLLRDEAGQPTEVVGYWVDITARKEMEAARRESEEKYRALIETTGTGYVIIDAQGRVEDANQEYVRLTGHENLAQIVGRSVLEWTAAHDLEINAAAVKQCLESGLVRNLELDYVNALGQITPIEVNATVIGRGADLQILSICRAISERKQGAAALAAVSRRHQVILESLGEGVFGVDGEGRITFINPAALDLLGYRQEDLLGRNSHEVLHHTKADGSPHLLEDCAIIRTARHNQYLRVDRDQLWRKGGVPLPVAYTIAPLTGAEPGGAVVVFRDISNRLQAEEERRESEEKFRAIFDNAYDGIALAEIESQKFYLANATWLRLLGYDQEELAQLRVADVHPPEDVPFVLEQFHKLAKQDLFITSDIPVKRKDGSVFFADIASFPLSLHGKSYLVGVFRDTSERRKMEAALRESEKQFRQIAETVEEVFWIASPDYQQILYVSPAYEKIWGRAVTDIYRNPQNWLEAIHPEDRDKAVAAIKKYIRGEADFQAEYRIVRPDGTVRWIKDRGFPVRNEQGEVYRIAGLAADITPRKKMELELRTLSEGLMDSLRQIQEARRLAEEANRAKGDFLANVGHELRTPLNAVTGFSQVMKDELYGPLNPKQRQYMDRIGEGAARLTAIINRMLDLAQLSAGEVALTLIRTPLGELLRQAQAFYGDLAARRRISLSLKLEPGAESLLEVDLQKFQQIMFNLLENAVKFTPEGGAVMVTGGRAAALPPGLAGTPEDWAQVSVQDTGIGMAPEDLPLLFQDFVQLEAPLTKTYAGVGLGLAQTRRLVELHGGRIWAESQPGQGSVFTFILPLKHSPEEEQDHGYKDSFG